MSITLFAVCDSIHIAHDLSIYDAGFRECTMIKGSLQLTQLGDGTENYYANLTFPALTEITEFLVVYQARGLHSLAQIFPNLSVIRGQKLLHGNVLIIHDMPDLEDVGLPQLRVIQSGAVFIKGNPQLCYVDTIDWTAMSRDLDCPRDVITMNRDANECVDVCPVVVEDNMHSCPVKVAQHEGLQLEQALCWNNQHCQIGERLVFCVS